jgi:hypothetical protein
MATPSRLISKEGYGPPALAVSVATTLMKKAKVPTWARFIENLDRQDDDAVIAVQSFELDTQQWEALKSHQDVVSLVDLQQSVSLAFCANCGGFIMLGQDSNPPKKCNVGDHCEGELYKASAATRAK